MQDSLSALNQFKNKLFIFSFGLGLASTVSIFQPNAPVKEIGKTLLGFSIAGVVLGELVTSKAFSFYNKDANKFDELITSKTQESNEVTRNFDKLTHELTVNKTQSQQLETQLSKAIDTIKSRDSELVAEREKIYQLSSKLKDVGRFSTAEAHKSDVVNLQNHAGKTIQELKAENEAQVRAIVSDWVQANNKHIENYEVNYTELIEAGKQAIAKLQERDSLIGQLLEQIEGLQNELDQLRKPWQFPGTIDYAVAGNAIINFYHQAYGYVLDAIGWQETETGYTLTFAVGRNKTYLTADMLHDKDNQPQLAGLTNALTLPAFTPNYQSGLMVLEVQTRKPAKKKAASETDINKLWTPASKFEATVKGWSRVRITGGSESGKSPTAENLAVCILKNRPGTAKLYNPQHDSVKNYWTVPTVGTSHKGSEKAIANLAKQVDARSNGQQSRDNFELSIFDEIDSTMSHTKGKKSAIGGDVNFIIKQASHQNLGAIFIGQNANVSEYPGMDRSDWNSAINIHIGSNAYDALTNTNLLTTEETTRLKGIADKLTDFCNAKNDDLGLDKTDPNSYRFALVMEPNKKPYFIELPAFGTYTYDVVVDVVAGCQPMEDASATQQPETLKPLSDIGLFTSTKLADSGYVGCGCPGCSSTHIRRNGIRNGLQRYICKDCGKHFTSEKTVIPDIGF